MSEVRNGERMVHGELSGGGLFIRRVASPAAMAAGGTRKPLARRVLSASSNKENAPPVWAVRPALKRRSPLPEWYPRTALHDITTVVKAVERKGRLRDAAARQQSQRPEESLQPPDHPTPVEQRVPHCTPPAQNSLLTGASPSGSDQIVASHATSLVEGELKASSASPSDYCSLQTPSKPVDPALADLIEKKLSSSIEQIEKMVRRNLKRTPKAAQRSKKAIQRRTLMSMR